MKWEKSPFRNLIDRNRDKSVKSRLNDRIAHINRKMSRGASNIYKMMRTRSKWGNKQLWGFGEKSKARHFNHFVPKIRSASKKILSFRRRPKK